MRRVKPVGSGRKLLYGELVKRIKISVPASKEKEIREQLKDILRKYITKNVQ